MDLGHASEVMRSIGIAPTSWTNTVVVAEALERGVTVEKHPTRRGLLLSHGAKSYRWSGGANTLNTRLAILTANQKDVASRLLRNAGHNAPENAVFRPGETARAWAWADELLPVVLKPRDGRQGNDVHVGVREEEEFFRIFDALAERHGDVLVEKFCSGTEHRCLLVEHKLIAVTERRPASVEGDGRSSVAELVSKKNKDRGRIHKPLSLGPDEQQTLARAGLHVDSVPKEGQRVYLRVTSNLHTGGDAIDATDAVTPEEKAQIEAMSRSIPGLRVAGFDVLLPRSKGDGPLTVLEVNKAPMISMHHFPWEGEARNAAGAVLDAMFPAVAPVSKVSLAA